jgi:hypothetical protein
MTEVEKQASTRIIKESPAKETGWGISHPIWIQIVRYCPEQIG